MHQFKPSFTEMNSLRDDPYPAGVDFGSAGLSYPRFRQETNSEPFLNENFFPGTRPGCNMMPLQHVPYDEKAFAGNNITDHSPQTLNPCPYPYGNLHVQMQNPPGQFPVEIPVNYSRSPLRHNQNDSHVGSDVHPQAELRMKLVCLWMSDVKIRTKDEEDKTTVYVEGDTAACDSVFYNMLDFVRHINNDHVGGTKQTDHTCYWVGCTRHGEPFKAKHKLCSHIRVHTGERPFRCEHKDCQRTFSRVENLKIHFRTHTGEKPFRCTYENCKRRFTNSSDRKKHVQIHTTQKPYVCKVLGCLKRYAHPSSLRKHTKAHKMKGEVCHPAAGKKSLYIVTNGVAKKCDVGPSKESTSDSGNHSPRQRPFTFQANSYPSPLSASYGVGSDGTELTPPVSYPYPEYEPYLAGNLWEQECKIIKYEHPNSENFTNAPFTASNYSCYYNEFPEPGYNFHLPGYSSNSPPPSVTMSESPQGQCLAAVNNSQLF